MLRTAPQPAGWKLGPALCAGLTLAHYDAFALCPSLTELKQHFAQARAEEMRWGVHVLVSQNGDGGLTLGDTHEYGATHDPFQREALDRLVLAYLDEFACIPERSIAEHWTGYYPKLAGKSELVLNPMPGVTLVNALGGAGMTMSFGLAEEIAAVGAPLS
jgi:glycine/D-amino acid oxidase-like deaminating enzyme